MPVPRVKCHGGIAECGLRFSLAPRLDDAEQGAHADVHGRHPAQFNALGVGHDIGGRGLEFGAHSPGDRTESSGSAIMNSSAVM